MINSRKWEDTEFPRGTGKKASKTTIPSPPSSFRAQREIFLAQRSNDEREMRSRRSTQAILSLPHEYKVPLRRKRSLGSAFDDDTRGRTIPHSLSFLHVEGCPFGADLSSAFGAPLLQGATQRSCKNVAPSQGLLPISSFRAKTKAGNPVFHTTWNHGISCSKALTQVTSHQSPVTSNQSLILRDTL